MGGTAHEAGNLEDTAQPEGGLLFEEGPLKFL